MRYFRLCQGAHVRNVMDIQWAVPCPYKSNPTEEEFKDYPDVLVGYYKYSDMVTMPDVLEKSFFFVSDEVKHVLHMYDESIPFKAIHVYPFGMVEDMVPLYWTFYPPKAECLHSSVRIFPNGEPEELILDKRKIPEKDVFGISNICVNRIIVSLPVAESLLRRNMFGISLKEVLVK